MPFSTERHHSRSDQSRCGKDVKEKHARSAGSQTEGTPVVHDEASRAFFHGNGRLFALCGKLGAVKTAVCRILCVQCHLKRSREQFKPALRLSLRKGIGIGVKSPQSTAAAFNHYLQQEGQSPVTVKINGQNFNGSGLSYAGGAPAGGSSSSGGVSGVTGRQRTVDTGIDWGSVHASGNSGQGLALADDSGFSLLGRSPTRLDYFGGYHPRSTNTHIDMRPQDTLETAGVNTQYTRDSRPQLQPVPFGTANLILSPETDISDSEKGVANRAFMINQAVNPAPNTTYGASFTGSGIRPTATQYDPETGRVIRNVTLVRDSEYAPDSGETPTADGQSPAGYAAGVSPESEFDNTEFMVMPIDDYLARESSEHQDVDRLGTRVDRRIQDMVRNIRVDV